MPFQLLAVSKSFPRIWERQILLAKEFENYGEVTGITIVYTSGQKVKALVSFKDPKVVSFLIGKTVQVAGAEVALRQVTKDLGF